VIALKRFAFAVALLTIATALAFGIYMFLFGMGFAINYTYFPELREYIDRIRPMIVGLTWVATFSTLSLIYVLLRDCRRARRAKTLSHDAHD
jgi:hypothetical protein